jgi:hypothetical protein
MISKLYLAIPLTSTTYLVSPALASDQRVRKDCRAMAGLSVYARDPHVRRGWLRCILSQMMSRDRGPTRRPTQREHRLRFKRLHRFKRFKRSKRQRWLGRQAKTS